MTTAAPLPRVARSEHAMIALARALVSGATDDAVAVMRDVVAPAPAIGPSCAGLLEDALAQVWRALWRRGGSRPGVSPDGTRGRLWQRYPVTPLAFSARSLELLRWMVANPLVTAPIGRLGAARPRELEVALVAHELSPLALGDQVIAYLALDAARGTPAQAAIAALPLARAAPLAWLGFPDVVVGEPPPAARFETLCAGAGPIVIEALAGELARRWTAAMLAQRTIADPGRLTALGASQDAVLTGFLDACDRHARRYLAGFVLDAVAPLLARHLGPAPIDLDPGTPLAARAAARRASGAVLRAVRRWAAWDAEHRTIRYIDDDYAAAQQLLARFERVGDAGVARIETWLSELTALGA